MRLKIGEYLLDVSKLILAGVVLSTVLEFDTFSKIAILLVGLGTTILFAIIGFIVIRGTK